MTAKTLFTEQQHFRQGWLWIILLLINGILISAVCKQILLGHSLSFTSLNNAELSTATTGVLLVSLLIAILRLDTEISEDGVCYRFFPFQLTMKVISWERISQAYVRQYNPISEYGGWGIRIGIFGSGQAFNVSGNKGLQLIYDGGKKFLLGTNRPEDLQKALQQLGRLRR